jgi:hypothetical protein
VLDTAIGILTLIFKLIGDKATAQLIVKGRVWFETKADQSLKASVDAEYARIFPDSQRLGRP